MRRERLYLLPVYIGSFKYYEKIVPALNEKYDVRFLIIRPDDDRRRGMIGYAQERGLSFDILDVGLTDAGRRLPFWSPLSKHFQHMQACRRFLRRTQAKKLISVKAISTFSTIFREANALGVETIVLQSALVPPQGFYSDYQKSKKYSPVAQRIYFFLIEFLRSALAILFRGPQYYFVSSRPQKVGVIGEEGRNIFHNRFGFDISTIEVVGSAEFQQVSELCDEIKNKPEKREQLLRKYSLDERKKKILILSSWYENYAQVKSAHTVEEDREQVSYFQKIVETIRSVCEEDVEILFKLHPAERNIYESYRAFGVKLYADEASSEELVVLSDLYIADPCTSANYMVIASKVPAIFFNATPLKALNKCTLFFPINRVEDSFEGLFSRLVQFKEGTLPLGYTSEDLDLKSIDRIVRFIDK